MLACATTAPDEAATHQIRRLARSGLDWEYLIRLARAQGVLPLLYRNLSRITADAVPEAALHDMKRHYDSCGVRNAALLRELAAIIDLLAAYNIRGIPYKGPILAATVYGDVGLRGSSDLDILLARGDFTTAIDVLRANDYRVSMNLMWKCHLVRIATPTTDDGRDPATPGFRISNVDLHRSAVPEWYGFHQDFDLLWERRTYLRLDDDTVPHLSPEDLLVTLALDVAKDAAQAIPGYLRLNKLVDIAELIERGTGVRWNVLERLVEYERVAPALQLALSVTEHLFKRGALGGPLAISHPKRPRLVPQVAQAVLAIPCPEQRSSYERQKLREFLVVARLKRGWVQKCLLAMRRLSMPDYVDGSHVPTADKNRMSHLFRLARLSRRCLVSLTRRYVMPGSRR